jgi:hypothetical protein
MCYSVESSLTTFLLVFIICSYLWVKGGDVDKTVAIILFFISLMQIPELFIWLNLECSATNKRISLLVPILLFLQPIVIILAMLYYESGRMPRVIYKYMLGIWLLCFPFFMIWMKSGFNKCTTVGRNGHLEWSYANSDGGMDQFMQMMYNVILGISIGTLNTHWYGLFYVGLSGLSYNYVRKIYGHSWGSVWCNFVNFLALGALFIQR